MHKPSSQATYWAVVPSAGAGKRLDAIKPKQYSILHHKPVIAHTLSCLATHPQIHKIVVVTAADDPYWPSVQATFPTGKIITAVGSTERYISVYQGLLTLQKIAAPDDWVLVHDAVRPCIQHAEITHLITTLQNHAVGGLLGVRVRDTLKRTNPEKHILGTVDREDVWQAQTPQMFRYGLLCGALQAAITAQQAVTDEASAVELMGHQPLMVEGSADNIKITYAEDLVRAERYILSL